MENKLNIAALFEEHLKTRLNILENLLHDFEHDGLILGAGPQQHYYQDDQEIPFHSSHHFSHYCPAQGAEHALILSPGKKPVLCFYHPQDFWYDHTPLGDSFWSPNFEVKSFSTIKALWKELANHTSHAWLGPDSETAAEHGLQSVSEAFQHHLFWHRAIKSPYEAHCVEVATEIAAPGHAAARQCFLQGGSELDIHLAYLSATRMTDHDLPYNTIVGLNEKAAILHYAEKRDDFRNAQVLLIDSGAKHQGYASDITRTHTCGEIPEEFNLLLDSMESEQQGLCDSIRLGQSFGDLHHDSHLAIGRVLLKHGVLKDIELEDAVGKGLIKVFYPHGIGHMLGLLVHDVGGRQADPAGTPCPADERHPNSKSRREIEPGFLFTVEPGLYFIKMLLDPQRHGEYSQHFNWQLIDRLEPYGGIRIEDNLYITEEGTRNITREYLP
jgi:Xaa-Pro dipeptidase